MDILDRNMDLLKNKNPILYNRINDHRSSNICIISSRTGYVTAKYNDILLHSMYDPVSEAKTRISALNEIGNCSLLICIGLGFGYELAEAMDRINERCGVLLVIDNMDIFRAAMEHVDLSKILSFDKLAILDGTNRDLTNQFKDIARSVLLFVSNVEFYINPVTSRLNRSFVEKTINIIKNELLTEAINIGNSVEDNLDGLSNTLRNFNNIVITPDLRKLKGAFSGIPAVCVAAGPSLDKNLHFLKSAHGKAVVFAPETILQRLRRENIKFNFASVIERTNHSYDLHFKNKPLEDDVVLLADSVVSNKILDEHAGKNIIIFRNTTYVERSISEKLNGLNGLDTGMSAATLNFAVADYLGFSPIILVGQDLAYGLDGEDHAKGTYYHDDNYSNDLKSTGEILEDAVYLKANNGGMIKSNKLWKLFLESFERMIENNKTFCINATEGGAYIKGTDIMTLENAIDKYCNREVGMNISSLFKEPSAEEQKQRRELLMNEIGKQKKDTERVIELCSNMKTIFEEHVKENCIFNKNKNLKDYVNVVSVVVNEIIKCEMPAFIIQAMTANLIRNNRGISNVDDKAVSEYFYKLNYGYFEDVEKIMHIMLDIYTENNERM